MNYGLGQVTGLSPTTTLGKVGPRAEALNTQLLLLGVAKLQKLLKSA